jgi:hypothetical protein
MSNIKFRYYAGFTVVLIALVAYIALAFQYSMVSADTFHNEIEKVVNDYSDSVQILHEGDDSKDDSTSHPLNKVRLQADTAINDASISVDTIYKYISVQNHTYALTDMAAGVGYYGYEYETQEQALAALKELETAFTVIGAHPAEVNGIVVYEAINPDDEENVTYWQFAVYKNSLYLLMVDGYINGLDDSPPVQEVFQDILSKMN